MVMVTMADCTKYKEYIFLISIKSINLYIYIYPSVCLSVTQLQFKVGTSI